MSIKSTATTAAMITVRVLKRPDGFTSTGASGALVLISGVSVDKLAPSENRAAGSGQFNLARNFVMRR